ncbi:MAG: MMPL family transporter [Planctomycetaceae bacterium]|nr:MMPL family transporter [Planctomycetaceae bacterium]
MDDRDQATSRSAFAGMLSSLARLSAHRPGIVLSVVAVTVIASIALTATSLRFKTDRSDLIDPSAPFQQRWLKFTEDFGYQSDIVVLVESSEPESIKQVLNELGGVLEKRGDLFTNVLYKVEPGNLRKKGLQYLSPDDLAAGLARLDEYRPILTGRWDLVRLENLVPLLDAQLKRQAEQSPGETERLLHHADRLVESLWRLIRDKNDFSNPWPEILPVDRKLTAQANQTVYLLNETGTMGFVMATPVKTADQSFEGATAAIQELRRLSREFQRKHADVRISLTGIPVLENDEMRRSQEDMTYASLASFAGVAILLLFGFRGLLHPLLGLGMLAVGMAWAFGFTTLAVGHLNILSVSFAAILIGLGIDFGIHILARYLELRHQGMPLGQALVATVRQIGPGVLTGAITTSAAFLCAVMTEFLGVAELGIIAGGGILLCALAAFIVLPALIAVADRHREPRTLPSPFPFKTWRNLLQRHPLMVLCVSLLCFSVLGWQFFDWSTPVPTPRVRYDHNLLNLQAPGLESVQAQRRIFEGSRHSVLYAISLADSPAEARRLKEQFEKLPTVHHVEELATRLPDFPSSQTQLMVQAFSAQFSKLPETPPAPASASPVMVGRQLESFLTWLKTRDDELSLRIADRLDEFLGQFSQLRLVDQMRFLGEFEYRLSYSLLAQFRALADASDPNPVTIADLPTALSDRYISDGGRWMLQVFPKNQIWDMEPLERFVADVRSVDPEVTGTPLQNYEAARQIKTSYEICAGYALAITLLLLLVDFLGSDQLIPAFLPAGIVLLAGAITMLVLEAPLSPIWLILAFTLTVLAAAAWIDRGTVAETLLAMLPPVCGLLLTFAGLVVFDIPLNPANLIILPLIIGIGVDSGVHILHDFHQQKGRYIITPSIMNSILMTSSTTMVGFGSMMLAAHRGLYSLGAVLTLGVASCLFISLFTLPALLSMLSERRMPEANLVPDQGTAPASDQARVA